MARIASSATVLGNLMLTETRRRVEVREVKEKKKAKVKEKAEENPRARVKAILRAADVEKEKESI